MEEVQAELRKIEEKLRRKEQQKLEEETKPQPLGYCVRLLLILSVVYCLFLVLLSLTFALESVVLICYLR